MANIIQGVLKLLKRIAWEKLLLLGLIAAVPFLVFYNLDLNPRPWHDEGSYLTLAKTLEEDHVYAVHNSDGYQTFGAVQSLGPTVILPIAWSFRYLDPDCCKDDWFQQYIYYLLQSYSTLPLVYYLDRECFSGSNTPFRITRGWVFDVWTTGSGEVPAFGFFMASWLTWFIGVRKGWWWQHILSGLFLGAAIITKNQYLIIGFASIGLLALLDLVYYRLGEYKWLIVVGMVAAGCVAVWYEWQILYFGKQLFSENISKLNTLAGITMGFNLHSSLNAMRFLLGSGSGYLYVFWGFPALVYAGILASRRSRESFSLAYLVIFSSLWLSYFIFVIIPWSRYIFPATAILAIFVSKLFIDLLNGLSLSAQETWFEVKEWVKGDHDLSSKAITGRGTSLTLLVLVLWSGYQLQKVVRENVLDKAGFENVEIYTPPQFSAPNEIASFLNEYIPKDKVIETWERELGILTDHKYHYPDSSLLAQAHKIVYRSESGVQTYAILGETYFKSVKPDYVVVGWYSRFNHLYDMDYLNQHAQLIKSIGDEIWGYEVYKLDYP